MRAFWQGFGLLATTTLLTVAIPYLMKRAMEAITLSQAVIWPWITGLVVLAMGTAWLRMASRMHVFGLGRQVEYALRQEYQAHLLRMDAPFFDRTPAGDLLFQGTNDILAVRMFIGPGFLQLSNTLMAYALTLPVMIHLDPWLTLIVLSPYPLVLVVARLLTKHLYRLSRQSADCFGTLTGFVQERLAGVAVIRNHGQEGNCRQQFRDHLRQLHRRYLHHARLQSLFTPMMHFAGGLSGLLLLGYGGERVARGLLTVGDFVAFSGYLAMLVWPTIGLGWILTVLQRGLAGLDRLHQTLSQAAVVVSTDPLPAPSWRGRIAVRNLDFWYHQSARQVLFDLSLEIPAGCFVGVVGQVGCGKSTLLHCLARLYPVPAGTILLDEREINTIPEEELRANLVLASQESHLFAGTVMENLLFGRPAPNPALAWTMAERVAMAEEIRGFPQQLDSPVGERGITLSGGQRQRVALARALAAQAPILLLDDIFASVDARTEAVILDNLLQCHPATVVMVCHRVAALHRADVIHVMEAGRIVASGTHAQLMAASPLYRQLHSRMARAETLENLAC